MSFFSSRTILMFVFVFVLASFLVPAQTAQAQNKDPFTGKPPDNILPLPPLRARVNPPPIPVPLPKLSSNTRKPADESAVQNPTPKPNEANVLPASGTACLDFEGLGDWGSNTKNFTIWDDQFGGWGPFAVDDGGLYEIENVRFEREANYRSGKYAFKIASTEPYAAGLASPTIPVNKGDVVMVTVNYFIWEHKQAPRDWVSMGVKEASESANCADGCYVNGYTRGRWAKLSKTVTATSSSGIMILLQAESPQNLNSNIYFDELEIQINGKVRTESCKLADK